ncbi:hypothetical protein ACFQ9X_10960 [Catenulispora yoronensis]
MTPGNKSKHAMVENMPFELYFMTGMAAYGALFAVFSPTTRIALDRQRGWTRQTRVTPSTPPPTSPPRSQPPSW